MKSVSYRVACQTVGGKQSSAARQVSDHGENSSARDNGRARSSPNRPAVKRVGGGYLHTPQPAPKADTPSGAPDSGPESLPQAAEQDSNRQSLPPVLPALSKLAAADGLNGELAAAMAQMRIRAAQTDAEETPLSAGIAEAHTVSREDTSISSHDGQVTCDHTYNQNIEMRIDVAAYQVERKSCNTEKVGIQLSRSGQ